MKTLKTIALAIASTLISTSVFAQNPVFTPPVIFIGPNFSPILDPGSFFPQAQSYHYDNCNGDAGCFNSLNNTVDLLTGVSLVLGQNTSNLTANVNNLFGGVYTRISGESTNAKAYTDFQSRITLGSSIAYTDNSISVLQTAVTNQINSAISATLTSANNYTDFVSKNDRAYTDAGDIATLNAAAVYTRQVGQVIAKGANDYTDNKVSILQTSVTAQIDATSSAT